MGKSSKDGCCNYIKKLHDAFKLKTHKSYMMKRTLPKYSRTVRNQVLLVQPILSPQTAKLIRALDCFGKFLFDCNFQEFR